MTIIEPSILSADFTRLGEQVKEVEAAGATAFQIDIMDGCFVPNLSFGPGIVSALRPLVRMDLDVHLMIVEPERYLQQFIEAGADRLIVHQEACSHLYSTLQLIKKMGIDAGVTLNPGTPINAIEEVLEVVDLVQVMTVNPGFGGQEFLTTQLSKISRLKQMLEIRGLNIPIAVDGGIDVLTVPLVVKAGASVLIAGSSVFNQQNSIAENLNALINSTQKK